MSNPFAPTLTRLKLPEGCQSVSARGIEITGDDDGCVEVPPDVAADLRSHGLTDAPAKAEKPAGKGAK